METCGTRPCSSGTTGRLRSSLGGMAWVGRPYFPQLSPTEPWDGHNAGTSAPQSGMVQRRLPLAVGYGHPRPGVQWHSSSEGMANRKVSCHGVTLWQVSRPRQGAGRVEVEHSSLQPSRTAPPQIANSRRRCASPEWVPSTSRCHHHYHHPPPPAPDA